MCGKHSAQGARHGIGIPSARRQRVRPRRSRSLKKLGQRVLARWPRTFLTFPCVYGSNLPAMETIQMRNAGAARGQRGMRKAKGRGGQPKLIEPERAIERENVRLCSPMFA